MYSQEINIDVGKHNKNIKVSKEDSILYFEENIFKKEIVGTILINKKSTLNYDYLKNPEKKVKFHKSTTFLNDTTSVSFNNEYLDIRPINYKNNPTIYLKKDYVTNYDWNLFRQFVIDSIARRILGSEFPDDFLIPTYNDEFGVNDEKDWTLNWKTNFRYLSMNPERGDNHEYAPLLNGLFFPPNERCPGKKEFDSRKYFFEYSKNNNSYKYDIKEVINIYRDSTLWINNKDYNNLFNLEDAIVTTYNSHDYFKNYPVTGINAEQAKAYLAWRQKTHQKELDSKSFPIKVVYCLPTYNELKNIESPKKLLSINEFGLSNWAISNKEYKEFVIYTIDSIARRIISTEYPDYFLVVTYDGELEEQDESEWLLNYQTKISIEEYVNGNIENVYYEEILNSFNYKNPDFPKYLNLEHYFYDFKTASIIGDFEVSEILVGGNYNCDKKFISCKGKSKMGKPLTKDLMLGYTNSECYNNDVRSHNDRSRFIIKEIINIYPGIKYKSNILCGGLDENRELIPCEDNLDEKISLYDFDSNPEKLITNISYSQFRAYWLWKIRKKKFPIDSENPLLKYYIPNEKEFIEIQNNRKIIHKAEFLPLPTPTFRYCIRFYPKDN